MFQSKENLEPCQEKSLKSEPNHLSTEQKEVFRQAIEARDLQISQLQKIVKEQDEQLELKDNEISIIRRCLDQGGDSVAVRNMSDVNKKLMGELLKLKKAEINKAPGRKFSDRGSLTEISEAKQSPN